MYTLRTVTQSNKQINQTLGNLYSLIERDYNYQEFAENYKQVFGKEHDNSKAQRPEDDSFNVYGFIQHSGDTIPLYEGSSYYIMTESGKTFSNLSLR